MMSYTLVKGGSMGSCLEEEQKPRRYSGNTLTLETAHFWCEKVKHLLETIPCHSGERITLNYLPYTIVVLWNVLCRLDRLVTFQ